MLIAGHILYELHIQRHHLVEKFLSEVVTVKELLQFEQLTNLLLLYVDLHSHLTH